jgi:transcriptional regulator with XRE-family HTH domain
MSRPYRSRRARLAALRVDLRAQGCSWSDIATRLRREEGVTPLVAFRLAHGLTQRELAERWNQLFLAEDGSGAIADKHISYWETWPESGHEPSLRTLKRLARLFECDISELVEDGSFRHLDAARREDVVPASAASANPVAEVHPYGTQNGSMHSQGRDRPDGDGAEGGEPEDMRRRTLLASSAVVADRLLDRPTRALQALQTVAEDLGDGLGLAADGLSEIVAHYAQSVSKTPSPKLYDDLLSIRSYANGLLSRAARKPASRRRDLVVATGQLSSLLAVSATDLGDHAAALVWCTDTERRGHDSRYPDLLGWASLTRALIAYYQGHAQRSAALSARGVALTPLGTVVHAKLAAQEMRARAMLGDPQGMTQARTRASLALRRLPGDAATTGAFSIPQAEDPPYTATSLLLVNRYEDAVQATQRVIETVYRPQTRRASDQPTNYARSLLILALAEAGAGRPAEASAAGISGLRCGRPVWPTMVLASKLNSELADKYPGTEPANEFRAQYLELAASQTQPSLTTPDTATGGRT